VNGGEKNVFSAAEKFIRRRSQWNGPYLHFDNQFNSGELLIRMFANTLLSYRIINPSGRIKCSPYTNLY
jgi:hypothetical protein